MLKKETYLDGLTLFRIRNRLAFYPSTKMETLVRSPNDNALTNIHFLEKLPMVHPSSDYMGKKSEGELDSSE